MSILSFQILGFNGFAHISRSAMALLGAKPRKHGKRRHPRGMSCLLVCWMALSRDRWQRPFIQASVEGPTGVLHSPQSRRGPLSHKAARPVVGRSSLLWLPCLALLGTVTHRDGVQCSVRERLRGGAAPSGARKGRGDNPRMLTSMIKKAKTATELLGVLDAAVDRPIFNEFHASATCTQLAAFHEEGKLSAEDAKSSVLQRLTKRLHVLKGGWTHKVWLMLSGHLGSSLLQFQQCLCWSPYWQRRFLPRRRG